MKRRINKTIIAYYLATQYLLNIAFEENLMRMLKKREKKRLFRALKNEIKAKYSKEEILEVLEVMVNDVDLLQKYNEMSKEQLAEVLASQLILQNRPYF